MKRFVLFITFLWACYFLYANEYQVNRVNPTHWWVGMKNNKLQLMLSGPNIQENSFSIRYPGVTLMKVHKPQNRNYVFLDLVFSPAAKPGIMRITIRNPDGTGTINYELKKRSSENGRTRVLGITSKDVTYLLMPDRFANGDPSNDGIESYRDKTADRSNKFARHGGDLKGVLNKLDYFNQLGVTAIWFTPVTENDMPRMKEGNWDMAGYHGYWFTDHYEVDKRFGGNAEYKAFVKAAHDKGLKVIQDAIYNHVGLYHWINMDPPSPDWVNRWPQFTGPNHREETLFDPYSSAYDRKHQIDTWFVPHLPDLNLRNSFLSTYLVQHAIWSVEEFGFDGFRIDTYKYCYEPFLNAVNAALLSEFPKITTFVEAWSNTVVANAYYGMNNINRPGTFKHNAQGVIDFTLAFALHAAMNQPSGWTEGVNRLYMTLAQDIVYKNPLNNCIFLDNHDMDRVYSVIGEDWEKMKWGLNWLLTMRGIPQLFYGTEILVKNFKDPTDAEVRPDFPGGWQGDPVNKFTSSGRNEKENEAFNYISKLAHFRKTSPALTTGKTMQYVVRDGVYIYFRYDDKQTVMVITNTGQNKFKPDWSIYSERTKGFSKMKNVITGETIAMEGFDIMPKTSLVLELNK